jgi:4-amino-4-deoxy-L-arabinose transferase-like glycosyltransferase
VSEAVAVGPVDATPRGSAVSGRVVGTGLATLVVVTLALVPRLIELRDVPRFTDETDEVMRGLAIARGEILPLTNVDGYIGPLWNYLLALGFVAVGPTTMLPRVLTVLAGVATVGSTIWLGAELARRLDLRRGAELIGFGAAALLATSSFHVVVSSRLGWSHSLTPLALTCTFALLLRWERTGSGVSLALGALGYSVSVHTHPTALALAPGLAAWAVTQRRALLRRPAAYAGLGLFVAANLPLLVFNLSTGLRSAEAAAQVRVAYSGGQELTPDLYVQDLVALLGSVPLLLGGVIGDRRGATVDAAGIEAVAATLLVMVGLAICLRRRAWLPPLAILSTVFVLPVFNGKYEPLFNGRYLAPLLPLAFVLLLVGLTSLAAPLRRRWTLYSGVSLVLVALALPSLVALRTYFGVATRDGPNNAELYQALDIILAAHPTRAILFDTTISGLRQSTNRDGVGVLEYVLAVDGHLEVSRMPPAEIETAISRRRADIVVVTPQLAARLRSIYPLRPLPDEEAARRKRRAGFVLLRTSGRS